MDNFENQNIERDSYKTGSTKPPKRRGGLVAGLLIAVILLAGVSSILGVMNIHLFRMLEAEKRQSVSFLENMPAPTQGVAPEATQGASGKPYLGLTVSSISELDRRFYQLPAGVLIVEVDNQSCAAKAGLAVGDVILAFNGVSALTAEELEQTLNGCNVGDEVKVEFYRYRTGMQQQTTVILEKRNG